MHAVLALVKSAHTETADVACGVVAWGNCVVLHRAGANEADFLRGIGRGIVIGLPDRQLLGSLGTQGLCRAGSLGSGLLFVLAVLVLVLATTTPPSAAAAATAFAAITLGTGIAGAVLRVASHD